MADSPDCQLDFASKIIFVDNNEERPPWKLCGNIERSLVFYSIHIILLIGAIATSLCFLFINKFSTERPEIWSLLAFSIGCFIPTPK